MSNSTPTSISHFEDYELDDTGTSLHQKAHETKQTHQKGGRFSLWLYFITLASLVTLIACVIFWSWLWQPRLDQDKWRYLVLNQYVTPSITITSIFLRTAMGVLASIATSMIASIAVEKHGVPLESVARFSIARFINNGPLFFFRAIFERFTFNATLRLLVAFHLCVTLASQFTSTLLVSDLASGDVIGLPETFVGAYDLGSQLKIVGTLESEAGSGTPWERAPYSSETFAKYHEPLKSADNVDDTGPTIRAFLPLQLQRDRERIQSMTGMAHVLDARVVCIRPKVSNVHGCTVGGVIGTALCGNITREETPDNIWGPHTQEFTLPLISLPTDKYRWVLTGMAGGLLTNLSNVSSIEDQMPSQVDDLFGNSFLLSDSLGLTDRYYDGIKDGVQYNTLNSTADGAWLHEKFQVSNNGIFAFQISLSWCYHSYK